MAPRPETTLGADGIRRLPPDAARALIDAFDLRGVDADFLADPYPVYHAFREHAPIHLLPDGSYLLTRYADLKAVYADTRRFSSDKTVEFKPKFGDGLLYDHHTTSLVFNDPPLHTRVRKLIAGALTPRAIAASEPALVGLVDRLLDGLAEKGTCDLIEDFAAAIPIEVIGNLLDVPHADRGPLRAWSLAILGALEPALTPAQLAAGEDAVRDFLDYLRGLVAARHAQPGDPEKDVLTRLIQGEVEGTRLTEHELLHNCIFILNAGHETTTNLIGNGLFCLHRDPEARARLIAEPALIAPAVEEFLRYESSNQLGNRMTTEAVTLGDVTLPAASRLTLCIGAANRDPAQFPDPDILRLDREPNRHLAFASGPHVCAGMNLARLEARIAIGRFMARFPHFTLSAPPVPGGRVRFRGFLSLPATVAG